MDKDQNFYFMEMNTRLQVKKAFLLFIVTIFTSDKCFSLFLASIHLSKLFFIVQINLYTACLTQCVLRHWTDSNRNSQLFPP